MSQDSFDIDVSYNGHEGLAKMTAANPSFDLLILDVMMPDFSGLDVCKAIHTDDKLKNIPVILASALPITSRELAELLVEFKSLVTIKGVIEKPFEVENLLRFIKQ